MLPHFGRVLVRWFQSDDEMMRFVKWLGVFLKGGGSAYYSLHGAVIYMRWGYVEWFCGFVETGHRGQEVSVWCVLLVYNLSL